MKRPGGAGALILAFTGRCNPVLRGSYDVDKIGFEKAFSSFFYINDDALTGKHARNEDGLA